MVSVQLVCVNRRRPWGGMGASSCLREGSDKLFFASCAIGKTTDICNSRDGVDGEGNGADAVRGGHVIDKTGVMIDGVPCVGAGSLL